MPDEKKLTAMISSTARDLPDYRKMVMDACLRLGFNPIMMEHLPGQDTTAKDVSTGMVRDADVYIGILAHSYGSSADDASPSYTEIEYEQAIESKIPILPFFVDEDTLWPPKLIDKGIKAEKLDLLKSKFSKGRIVARFKSPEDLRGHVLHALSQFKEQSATLATSKSINLHPPNTLPPTPERRYVAHPYVLLQTKDVVGRQKELKLLSEWITQKEFFQDVAILNIVAIGGMGKSALTWKWFEDIAPNERPDLIGRMWWSFYESDAYFENFIIRALAYTASIPEADARNLPKSEREDRLFKILDEKPFLLVLDGLERILLAYAGHNAAHLSDDDLDERTANKIAKHYGLPENIKQTYLEKHRLRRCTDHNAGRFLYRLSRLRTSRILISTRLYPAELQTRTAQTAPGCDAIFLDGLTDEDALELWRGFIRSEHSGASETLTPLFRSFGNYPLLLRALAGEIREYRPAPGNFDQWRKEHHGFNPAAELNLNNSKTHVLEFALKGLQSTHLEVLQTIAAFRMPAQWETLFALFCGPDKPCPGSRELDTILTELEDRGLIGWDKTANRYDLHPIVRNVVWEGVGDGKKHGIHTNLHSYFNALPRPKEADEIECLADVAPVIELFHKLVDLERNDEALTIYRDLLSTATFLRFADAPLSIELLERFKTGNTENVPTLSPEDRKYVLSHLAGIYLFSGDPSGSISLFRVLLNEGMPLEDDLLIFAQALRSTGDQRRAVQFCLEALSDSRRREDVEDEFYCLHGCSAILDTRLALQRAKSILILKSRIEEWDAEERDRMEAIAYVVLSSTGVQVSTQESHLWAKRLKDMAVTYRSEYFDIRAARLLGVSSFALGDIQSAESYLQDTVIRARGAHLLEDELLAITVLADISRQRYDYATARELLDEVWNLAERGPFPLWHADALNVLAQIERDEGNLPAAIAAATKAYTLAWCDGPPYAYHYGLTNARRHLRELGAPEPVLPPFDESKFEPMPEVEINPRDEYYVEVEEEGLDDDPWKDWDLPTNLKRP